MKVTKLNSRKGYTFTPDDFPSGSAFICLGRLFIVANWEEDGETANVIGFGDDGCVPESFTADEFGAVYFKAEVIDITYKEME